MVTVFKIGNMYELEFDQSLKVTLSEEDMRSLMDQYSSTTEVAMPDDEKMIEKIIK